MTLTIPLAALASYAPILPMTLGQTYAGSLTPSPNNPQGEVCYGLSVEPDTRITLNIKTAGVGIVKFAVYDRTKALRFFHNDVSNTPQPQVDTPTDSRFSFPAVSEGSQLCLTTTNPRQGQQYDFTVTGKPSPKSNRLALRSTAMKSPPNPPTKTKQLAPPPTSKPLTAPLVEIPPPPTGEPYCYVGTWQIADLSGYWLPSIQTFTQAKVTEPQMLGYAKVTINKYGYALFEAFDLEQKYTLESKTTGAKSERIGVSLSGSSTARFQANSDNTLTFRSQNYRRLTTKVNLDNNLKLTGDRLFMPFGDRDLPQVNLSYKCIDRDNITLEILLPTDQKVIPIALKRIN